MKKNTKHKIDAFSLAEMLFVMAVMGVLIMFVLPNNSGVVSRAKSLEAKRELMHLHGLQTAYHFEYSKYSNELARIGYVPHQTTKTGGTANYEITIVSSAQDNFEAQATAVNDFDGDGVFNIWTINKQGVLTEKQPD